jgi:hypothetical protein
MNIVSADEIPQSFEDGSLTSHGGVKVFANGVRVSVWKCDLTDVPEVEDLVCRSVMPIHAFNVEYVEGENKRWSVNVTFGSTVDMNGPKPPGCEIIQGTWTKNADNSVFGSKLIPVAGDGWMESALDVLWSYLHHTVGPLISLHPDDVQPWVERFQSLGGIPLRDLGYLAVDGGDGLNKRVENYVNNPDCSALMDETSTFYTCQGRHGVKAAATRLVRTDVNEIGRACLTPESVHLEQMPTILVMPISADCLTANQPLDHEIVTKHVTDIQDAYLAGTGMQKVGKMLVYKHNMMAKHALLISDIDTHLVLGNMKFLLPMIVIEFLRVGMVHLRNYIKVVKRTGKSPAPFDTVFPISPLFLVGRALKASKATMVIKRVVSKIITLLISMWTTGQIPQELVNNYALGSSDHELLTYLMENLKDERWMSDAGAGQWYETIYINETMVPLYAKTRMSGANMAIVETSRYYDLDIEDRVDVPFDTQPQRVTNWWEEESDHDANARVTEKSLRGGKHSGKVVVPNAAPFKGDKKQHFAPCYHCGVVGHIARFCPMNQRMRKVTCHNCGQEGHISPECNQPRIFQGSVFHGRGGFNSGRKQNEFRGFRGRMNAPPQRDTSPQHSYKPVGDNAPIRKFKDMTKFERSTLGSM